MKDKHMLFQNAWHWPKRSGPELLRNRKTPLLEVEQLCKFADLPPGSRTRRLANPARPSNSIGCYFKGESGGAVVEEAAAIGTARAIAI